MLTFSPECFCFEQEAPFYGFPSNWEEGCPGQAGAIVILGGGEILDTYQIFVKENDKNTGFSTITFSIERSFCLVDTISIG